MNEPGPSASMDDFRKLDVRIGRITKAAPFPEGRHSTHVLEVDLGPEIGTRKSVARLLPHYAVEELLGRLVLCVVNFPPRQIGPHRSEVLILGVPDDQGNTVLLQPERTVTPGVKWY
jgi:tRNA-binding protein